MMTRIPLVPIAAAALTLLVAPAFGQAIGSRIAPRGPAFEKRQSPKDVIEARRFMFDYARCVVRKKHDGASEAILANANNGDITERYSDLIRPECLQPSSLAGNISISFGGDLYRYALADALVNADFAAQGAKDFSDRLPLAHLPMPSRQELDMRLASEKNKRKRTELEQGFAKSIGVAWLSRYGECVVRGDPVAVRLWLLTRPDMPEEISRISALRAVFNNCLSDGTMTFNSTTMRGAMAINYYRLAMATVQPTRKIE